MKRLASVRISIAAVAVILVAGALSPVRAQDADDQQRGVARISLVNGDVSVRRGDSGEWVAAVVNAPLMTDDQIATGPNSRAEVEFDAANILRIGGSAEVKMTQLEAARFQMQVGKGTVTYRVIRPSGANVEVDSPSVSVRPSKQGIYRIYVNEAGETQVISRAGEVEVFTPRGSQWITAGQMMMARGSASDPEFQIVAATPVDDWDRWCDSRDRGFLQSQSAQYVGQGVYGTEDLDANGSWVDVAPYGHVWRPTVTGADWAPYSSGRWAWEDWYGWTWVSYDPWGWAPYHYGRWFSDPRWGWCWYPGGFGRHYWSPALVGWFGFGGGGGFGVGFGFGHVGWVPLAPFESFHPWWGRGFYGRGFGNNINVTNVNISNVYRNARVTGGISGMRAGDFQGGRFHSIEHFSGSQVGQAGLVRGQVPISPSSSHMQFSDRAASNVARGDMSNRQFFSHQQTNPAQRIPLAQQRSGVAGGNAGIARGVAGNAGITRGAQVASGNGGNGGNSGNSGWRRFGETAGQGSGAGRQNAPSQNLSPRNESNAVRNSTPNRMTENTRPPSASGNGSNGWQRFGNPGSGAAPRYNAPAGNGGGGFGGARNNGGGVAPQYSAPRNSNAPSYSAPRYSQPAQRSVPSYSAPRNSGGGGGGYSAPRTYSAPRSSGGGGGGGGGGHPSGGGGGSHGGGGGGHGHR